MPAKTIPKRRCLTAALLGHGDGLAALELHSSGFFFLLKWRIFKDLGAAVSVAASPSGVVPDGGSVGRVWRSKFISGEPELDGFLVKFPRVFSGKIKDYTIIYFSSRSFMYLTPTADLIQTTCYSGPFPFKKKKTLNQL
jgi:hypothetical protein